LNCCYVIRSVVFGFDYLPLGDGISFFADTPFLVEIFPAFGVFFLSAPADTVLLDGVYLSTFSMLPLTFPGVDALEDDF